MLRFSSKKLLFTSRRFFSHKNHPKTITFITDMEGQKNLSDINESKSVKYHHDSGFSFNGVHSNQHFIYGGDVTDRGNYDLTFLNALIDFKLRHPDNVHLLVGNREIKQCRFKVELAPALIRQRLLSTTQPRWLTKPTLPLDYLNKKIMDSGLSVNINDQTEMNDYVNSLTIEKCQEIYLMWMLKETMGCPHTFRYRGEELSRKNGNAVITNEEILNSFIHESMPDGLVGRYLQLGQVGVIIPDTRVMAVHGGLRHFNVGRIPGMTQDQPIIEDAVEWIEKFNDWYKQQINEWMTFKPDYVTIPACTALDACVLPLPHQYKSIITSDMQNNQQEFIPVDDEVNQYLERNNIQVVLRGHHPEGDYPSIIRAPFALHVNGDTGYAAFDPKNIDDTRGNAKHVIHIKACLESSEVNISGVLKDKTQVNTSLTVTKDGIRGDAHIGKITDDHRLVQCQLPDGDYRLIYQKGMNVNYQTVNEKDLESMLNASDQQENYRQSVLRS